MVRSTDTSRVKDLTPASMEPCLFRHGKLECPDHDGIACDASMEPCLFRHGKGVGPKKTPSDHQLQWSHVFSDMVRGRRFPSGLMIKRGLQWSHVFSDMVSRARLPRTTPPALLQWSHVFSDMVSTIGPGKKLTKLTLQWSHVFSDMVSRSAATSRST